MLHDAIPSMLFMIRINNIGQAWYGQIKREKGYASRARLPSEFLDLVEPSFVTQSHCIQCFFQNSS